MERTHKYVNYLLIPWPVCQSLYDIFNDYPDELLPEEGGVMVEKEWFDKNRVTYGL